MPLTFFSSSHSLILFLLSFLALVRADPTVLGVGDRVINKYILLIYLRSCSSFFAPSSVFLFVFLWPVGPVYKGGFTGSPGYRFMGYTAETLVSVTSY